MLVKPCHTQDGLWGDRVSHHFDGGALLYLLHRTHSGPLKEGLEPHVAVYSVHLWKEENSGASNVTILVTSLVLGIQHVIFGKTSTYSPFLTPPLGAKPTLLLLSLKPFKTIVLLGKHTGAHMFIIGKACTWIEPGFCF